MPPESCHGKRRPKPFSPTCSSSALALSRKSVRLSFRNCERYGSTIFSGSMMFCSIVSHGSMVGFWNAIPIRNALAATSRPPRMTTPVEGGTSPAPQPQDGRLAAAGRSDQRDELAVADLQRGGRQRRHRALAAAEGDRDV